MKTLANGGFVGRAVQGQHGDDLLVMPDRVSIHEALHFVWALPVSVLIMGSDHVDQVKEKIRLVRT